eukprot:SAG25_NODE_495_length_7403_cov_7.136911_10_plen_175_part_00
MLGLAAAMVHRRPRLLTAAEAMGRRCRHRRRKRERTRLQQMQQLLVLMLCTAAVVASLAAPASRSAIHKKRRMVWAERCASLNDREFTRRYRVNHDGFHYILDHIAPHMPPYRESAQEPHEHAVILSAVLRWCAGGHYLDICVAIYNIFIAAVTCGFLSQPLRCRSHLCRQSPS